jgi:hypothetical protein
VSVLRNIHAALEPGGLVVDTQPVSAQPRACAEEIELGRLDMRAWTDTIRAVDERVVETIASSLFELRHEQHFVVADRFDDGRTCLETVSAWRGTRVPLPLASRLEETRTPVSVEQEVRLRLLRRAMQADP